MTTDRGHVTRVPVRLRHRDMDTLGHLNQSVYHTFTEEARAEILVELLGTADLDFVLARTELDHRREVRLADREVVAEAWVERVGTSSVRVAVRVVKLDGTVAAEGATVMVGWDPGARTGRRLTDAERELLLAAMGTAP